MVTKEEALEYPDFNCPTVLLKEKLLNSITTVATMRAEREDKMSSYKFINVKNHHFIGLCGEAAVAGFYSIPLNLSYEHPIDPGYDFLSMYIPTTERLCIDVKTRTNLSGDLLVSTDNVTKNVDVYILCLKKDNEIALYGSATREMVENAEIISVEDGSAYRVPQDQLFSVAKREHIKIIDLQMNGLSAVDVDKNYLLTIQNT